MQQQSPVYIMQWRPQWHELYPVDGNDATKYITPQQIKAGEALIELYTAEPEMRSLWNILFAQMQSGKTGTLLFVAAELLRLDTVQTVIIMSGNAETALRDQLKADIENFGSKYRRYIRYIRKIRQYGVLFSGDHDIDVDGLWDFIKSRISVKWGSELKTCPAPNDSRKTTLYILDESHVAQNKKMRPHKFFARMGIEANGDHDHLVKANAMVLSVSATPFSEMSVEHHSKDKWKGRVQLDVSNEYIGVEKMLNSKSKSTSNSTSTCNMIEFVTGSIKSRVLEKLQTMKGMSPAYFLIRTTNDAIKDAVEGHAELSAVYKCNTYDSSPTSSLQNLDILKSAPSRHTIIFIKGKCRMGQVLDTRCIALCVETSATSNADTLLQGLLGRMCGYKQHHVSACIMLSDPHNKKEAELRDYIQLAKGDDVMPRTGMNLKPQCTRVVSETHPIIPILIRLSSDDIKVLKNDPGMRGDYKQSIIEVMRDGATRDNNSNSDEQSRYKNSNTGAQSREIYSRFQTPDSIHITMRTINPTTKNIDSLTKFIAQSVTDEVPYKLGSSFGIRPSGKNKNDDKWQINAFRFKDNITCENGFKIKKNDIYLDMRTTMPAENTSTIPQIALTTGREMFSRKSETGVVTQTNGGYNIAIDKESATNKTVMYNALKYFIQLSRTAQPGIHPPKCIESNCTPTECDAWQGIYVNRSVYKSLQKNGSIYNCIKANFNLQIKTKKTHGKRPQSLPEDMIRLSSISW